MPRTLRHTLTIWTLVFATAGGAARAVAAPSTAPGVPLDEVKELDEMTKQIDRFTEAAKDYKGTVNHVVQRAFMEKRKALTARYQETINANEADEKSRRIAAITLFEDFLRRYKNDDRWTPDAMFRLAELYFEKSNDEYLTATGQANTSGVEVKPEYERTINLYRELIARFPQYRLVDGAYYLLGWCLGEMGQEQESLQAMRALVCANKYKPLDKPEPPQPSKGTGVTISDPYVTCEPSKKDSRFLPEAWTRVGESHFDNSELELAIAAYQRVLEFKDSPYYDKALYKLAWSYYRADKYPEAIKRFDELVVFSDKKKSESGAEGSDLRAEAVQYLGISFAEKDWNGDSIDDPESGLERIEKFYKGRDTEAHIREIYAKLGDIYFDETEYFHAIEVYKRTLIKWPFDPANPKLQDRVVMANERMRNFDQALKEREALARDYTKGTDWYKKNRDNKEAIDTAAELAELALVSAAVNHHKAAQDLKKLALAKRPLDQKMLDFASKEYALAAAAYEKYLEQYPNSKNTYEYSYSYAEALYYSQRFLEAGAQYEKVRDSNLDNKYAEDAAFNTIKSYENFLDTQKKAGKFSEPPLPVDGKVAVPVKPIEVTDPVKKLQKAYDAFVARVPNSGRASTMAYKAAEIDYRHLHWDTARPRFETIVTKYCKEDVGANAGNAIIITFTIEKNLDKLAEWANRLKTANCGTKELAQKNTIELGKLSLGIKFKQADALYAAKKFEDAASLYVQIVDADPKGEDSDKALNNAAVAYESVNRFAAATRLYERIVSDYPTSKFLDDALFRTAVSYQKFFEFDKAVVSYRRLAEDKRFSASTHRTDSLYNAGVILENDQSYAKAADLFKVYAADKTVKREEASEAFFRAAKIYQKMKDTDRAIRTFKDYIKTFGSDPKGAGRVVEAHFRMAEIYSLNSRTRREAEDMYRQVVKLGTSIAPASDQAEYPAHAAFIITEERIPGVEKAKISGGGKKLAESIQSFKKNVTDLVSEYSKVIGYKRATWTLAAYFRTGYLFEIFSKALLAAPCPAEVKKIGAEACDIYRQQIEEVVSGVDDEAVKRYGVTLEQAGKLGVSNEWTKLARTRANAYKPDVFPMVKDEHVGMEDPK